MALIYSVSFWCAALPTLIEAYKKFIMQKQLRIISQNQISICKFGKSFSKQSSISKIAYSRHLGRVPVFYRPLPFITVRLLPCGWFVFRFKSGRRLLSPLPY